MSQLVKSYFLFLILAVGLIHFFIPSDINPINPKSSFGWPTADLFHNLERLDDANFLTNDFFTNTSSEKNPRTPYVALIHKISELFSVNYYKVLYALEWLIALASPIGIFLFFSKVQIKNNQSEIFSLTKNTLLSFFIALSSSILVLSYFRYAYWRPIPIWPAPQSLALCLSFYSGFLLLTEKKICKIAGIILLQISALIHPVNTLLFLGLFLILLPNLKSMLRYGLATALAIAPPILLIFFLFGDRGYHLNDQDFLRLYVVEAPYHAHHYMPNHFNNHIRDIILGSLTFGFVISLCCKNWRLAFISAILATSYAAAIQLQLLAFDLPNKSLLTLGPVRFSQFGYFMFALVYSGCLAEILTRTKLPQSLKTKFSRIDSRYVNIAVIFILLVSYSIRLYDIDDPKTDFQKKYDTLFTWIKNNSDEKDVFATPLREFNDLMIAVPIIAKRPVFYSGAAPFIEKYFEEAIERKNLLYGARVEWTEGGPGGFYCDQLTTKRLLEAANKYQLNWVIMANKCGSNSDLKSLKVGFKDENLTVYKIN